jgi:cobalt-zinc-cadmium efflux system outer membrane protein
MRSHGPWQHELRLNHTTGSSERVGISSKKDIRDAIAFLSAFRRSADELHGLGMAKAETRQMVKLTWAMSLLVVCCGCRTISTVKVEHSTRHAVVSKLPVNSEDDVRQNETPSRPSGEIKLTSAEAGDQGAEETSAIPVVSSLSLDRCISLGLAQNPDLIALRQTENAGSAALEVAQTYPFNPFVQVQATPLQDQQSGGPGTTYHYVLLMQTIQLAHQQQFREEGAASALNSTRWNIHQAELLNVAQTERLYFSTLYLRGLLELAKASDQNNQQLLRTLEKQLDAGQATAADVAIVRVDARSTKQQVRLAQANYETALRDLKRHLGLSPDDPINIDGDLRSFAWAIPSWGDSGNITESAVNPSSTAIASRVAARPDVLAAQADLDAARAAMSLATANKTPDLQIGPYYQRTADGTSFLGFRAQMDIPVINSGRPLEQQRTAEFNQRVTSWQQLQRRAELEAQAAWERYRVAVMALTEDASSYETDVPKELESLEQQFLAGEVDVVRVVQARASIIQNQRVRLDLFNEVAQSAANLTASATIPLEELLAPLQ